MSALLGAGVAAWSISPSSCMVGEGGAPASADIEPLRQALAAGLTPVTHGDVVMDRTQGSAVFSTETALITILRGLMTTDGCRVRALWMGDTDGVWDADGKTIDRISVADRDALDGLVGGAAATDVTGGMRHRLDSVLELADLGVESWILDGRRPGALASALAGQPVGGTHVHA
jgi:isopentenyl phosphate kinase